MFLVLTIVWMLVTETGGAASTVKDQPMSDAGVLQPGRKPPRCQLIDVPICRNIGYNMTSMPNLVGSETQQEAERQYNTYQPLLQYGCSDKLALLLCSTYFPLCTDKVVTNRLIGPCGNLCDHVRLKCLSVLNNFGFPWPSGLDCSRFPAVNNDQNMCMDGGIGNEPPATANTQQQQPSTTARTTTATTTPTPAVPPGNVRCATYCADGTVYVNKTSSCVPLCNSNVAFNEAEKRFVDIWITVWSTLCAISTTFALLTCLLRTDSVNYPERALVNMSFCFAVHTVGFFVRLGAGRQAASCGFETVTVLHPTSASSAAIAVGSAVDVTAAAQRHSVLLIEDGLRNADCAVVFVIIYYFSTTGWIWWLLATGCWLFRVVRHRQASTAAAKASCQPPSPATAFIYDGSSSTESSPSIESAAADAAAAAAAAATATGNARVYTSTSRSTGTNSSSLIDDALNRAAGPMHAVVWSVAAAQTVVAILLRSAVADELTGLCFVDERISPALVVAPLTLCAVLSSVFIAVGLLLDTGRRRRSRRHQRQPKRSSERCSLSEPVTVTTQLTAPTATATMTTTPSGATAKTGNRGGCHCRVGGWFSLAIFLLPAVFAIASYCYDFAHDVTGRDRYITDCSKTSTGGTYRPNIVVLSMRAVLTLAVGTVVSIVSVWNASTFPAWRRAGRRLGSLFALSCQISSPTDERKGVNTDDEHKTAQRANDSHRYTQQQQHQQQQLHQQQFHQQQHQMLLLRKSAAVRGDETLLSSCSSADAMTQQQHLLAASPTMVSTGECRCSHRSPPPLCLHQQPCVSHQRQNSPSSRDHWQHQQSSSGLQPVYRCECVGPSGRYGKSSSLLHGVPTAGDRVLVI